MAYHKPDTTSASYFSATPSGDCTAAWDLSWYQRDTTGNHHIMYTPSNRLVVTCFTDNLMIASNDGTRCFTASLAYTTSWTHLLVHKQSNGGCFVYQDGVMVGTDSTALLHANAGLLATDTVTMLRGGGIVSDIRMMPGAVDSTVWAYYRADVLAGGDKTLPNG
jgi:hypothetical protein